MAIAVASATSAGCSRSPYDLAAVNGKVTIDGLPFTQGKVMFAPIATGKDRNAGRPAFGLLEPDGSFSLTTYSTGDGAVVGEHWVTVIRIEPEQPGDDGPPSDLPPPKPAGPQQFSRIAVPTKVTVAADADNVIDVALTKQDVARYGVFD